MWATFIGSHLTREPTGPCINKQVVEMRTNIAYQFRWPMHKWLPHVVAKILATKFGFVLDWLQALFRGIHQWFPPQRASDADIWCFFDVSPNNLFNRHLSGLWPDTPWCSWCHCDDFHENKPLTNDSTTRNQLYLPTGHSQGYMPDAGAK